VLRKIFGPSREKVRLGWTIGGMSSFIICTSHHILGCSDQVGYDGLHMWREWGEKRNTCRVWWGNLKEGDHVRDRLRYTDNIKIDLEERNRIGEHGLD